jgi:riboflavin kinase/FMN adenylyltransferase
MNVVRGRTLLASEFGRPDHGMALAVGNFDGVHLGHQALIAEARAQARRLGAVTAALTFDPSPAHFFSRHLAPPAITPLARRLEWLEAAGADLVIVEPFVAAFASLSAEAFVSDVLAGDLGARHVVVGYDFSFGHKRLGTIALLRTRGAELNLGVSVIDPVGVEGIVCSSTKIREFILEGRVGGARLLLGRPFELDGKVVRGAGRGRGLGFPTANLAVEGELLPRPGIYAARAVLLDDGSAHPAAVSIGTNPTFPPTFPDVAPGITVEAHLLDFEGTLYDARLRLEFVERLRDEQRFTSPAELAAAIRQDVLRTREIVLGQTK